MSWPGHRTCDEAMVSLRKVEEKVLSLLDTSSTAFRSLSIADASRINDFESHSEKFLTALYEVQRTLRGHIDELEIDMPFENELGRRAVEADIILQGSDLVRKGIERILAKVEEVKTASTRKAEDTQIVEEGDQVVMSDPTEVTF